MSNWRRFKRWLLETHQLYAGEEPATGTSILTKTTELGVVLLGYRLDRSGFERKLRCRLRDDLGQEHVVTIVRSGLQDAGSAESLP